MVIEIHTPEFGLVGSLVSKSFELSLVERSFGAQLNTAMQTITGLSRPVSDLVM